MTGFDCEIVQLNTPDEDLGMCVRVTPMDQWEAMDVAESGSHRIAALCPLRLSNEDHLP